jgi:hypothetical protein
LADFNAEILSGLLLDQEAVIGLDCGRLRGHAGDGVSRPPPAFELCCQATALMGTTFSGASGMIPNHAAAWLLVTTFR